MSLRHVLHAALVGWVLVAGAVGFQSAWAREPTIVDVDYYDCSGKVNTFEVHPWDHTRFINCDHGRAHDKSCGECSKDPVTCPEGYLIFDYCLQQCETANTANKTTCDAHKP